EELAFELGTTFRVLRALAEKVTIAVQSNHIPLILAGECLSCVGTLAGLAAESTAIVWLDAHADFNTPETTGRCWQKLTSSVRGFRPAGERNVVLIGARDLDPEERALLERSAITSIDTTTIRKRGAKDALCGPLNSLNAQQLYLHIDLDVLDLSEARVNQFSSTGGLSLAELLDTVRAVAATRPVAAAAITAYDPSYDEDGRALRAGTALIKELIGSNFAPGPCLSTR